ncbi:MAG: type II secretion system F family protein [Pseudomonadota bacterium]
MLWFLILVLFISMTMIIYMLINNLLNQKSIVGRLKQYLSQESNKEKPDKEKDEFWRDRIMSFGKTLGKSKLGIKYREKTEIKLIQAHLPLKYEEYITINLIVLVVAAVISLVFTENIFISAGFAILASFLPLLYVNIRRKGIIHKIETQLPDTLALLSNTLKSGYSFLQAIDAAAKELPPPISQEFQQIMREINLGVNTEKALEGFGKRVQSPDLELIILAVLIQRQIGGNLSEILDNISETIRSRIKIKGEIKVLTAQGRVSGLIISLMPVVLGVVLYFMNPSYIMGLFKNPVGIGMLVLAVFMQAIGIFLIRRIIRIEV